MVAVEQMSPAERRVWDAFPAGQIVDFRTGDPAADDLTQAMTWGRERRLRAAVIAALLCGSVEGHTGTPTAVAVRGAYIEDAIELQDAELKHPLFLMDCCIEDGLDLAGATTRTLVLQDCRLGPVVLVHTTVDGQLDLRGTRLAASGEPALQADGLNVSKNMWCGDTFHADGEVRLVGANIGGYLDFRGAHLVGKDGPALSADRLKVAQNMFCGTAATGDPFRASGEVRLMWAQVGGQLVFRGARLTGVPQTTRQRVHDPSVGGVEVSVVRSAKPGLNAYGVNVAGDMICDGGFQAIGGVNLDHASVGVLIDDANDWPESLRLEGFTYRSLSPYMVARDRLRWLALSPEYHGQPYEHLATYYRQLGYDDQARRVLLVMQRARTQQQPRLRRWWGWLQDGLVGYGYVPGRAILLLTVAFLFGWAFFAMHHPSPVNPSSHPAFNAAIYTINLLIPTSVLGQPGDWDPHALALAIAVLLRAVGWLLAISVAAAITRTVARN